MEGRESKNRSRKPSQGPTNSKLPKPILKKEVQNSSRGKTLSLSRSRSSANVSSSPDPKSPTTPLPISSFQHHLERTNSQLESQASDIFSLEEMLCEIQENVEKDKKEEAEELKAAKDMLYVQVIELKADKRNLTETAEKETFLSLQKIDNLERKMKEKDVAFTQLTAELKEEQLASIAGLQERVLLKLKIETLITEIESSSQEKFKSFLEIEEMKKKIESAEKAAENMESGKVQTDKEQKEMNDKYAEAKLETEVLQSKLVDAETGLKELAAENQTMQVELVQLSGKKWVSDVEVEQCGDCGGRFSLTVRKHHCRRCGLIFCKDCSSKQAVVPEYKKPQRVCDKCFAELEKFMTDILQS